MSRELLFQLSPDMCAVDDPVLDSTGPIGNSCYSSIRLAKLDPLLVRSHPRTTEFSTAVTQNAN